MTPTLFAQLIESLHQGDAILKGEADPSRRFEVTSSLTAAPTITSTGILTRKDPSLEADRVQAKELRS